VQIPYYLQTMHAHPNKVFFSLLASTILTVIVRTSEVGITMTLSLNHAGCDYVQMAPVADHGSVWPEAYISLGALP